MKKYFADDKGKGVLLAAGIAVALVFMGTRGVLAEGDAADEDFFGEHYGKK